MVEIKPYNDQRHRLQVQALFADVGFKAELWDYQFTVNPGAKARGFQPVVAEDSGKVIGFNGVVPVSILWNGKTCDALWSCDFKVKDDYRGQGVGRLIKESLAGMSPVLMSFGISPVAAIVLGKMGWQASRDVHFLKRVCRPGSARDVALMVYQFLMATLNRSAGDVHYQIAEQDTLPSASEVDELWRKVSTGYSKTVVRDWAYMDWRYQQHPLADYRFLELRDDAGALRAIGVVRARSGQVRLVDYLGPAQDKPLKQALVKAMLSHWNDASAYSAMTSDAELKQVMKSCGFYQGREQPRFYVWASPHTFGPEDCDQAPTGWFIMGGDSDGELLQAARESWNENATGREDV